MLFRKIQKPVISSRRACPLDSISVQHLANGQARSVMMSNSALSDPPGPSGNLDEDDVAADKAPMARRSPKAITMPSAIGLCTDWQHLDISLFQNGALLIDKPLEWTSFDVCGKLRNSLRFLGIPKALKVRKECCRHATMRMGIRLGPCQPS